MEQELSYCRYCGTRWPDVRLSNRGACPECGKLRLLAAITQMTAHCGPIWDKWRLNYIAAMDGVLNRLRKELQEND